MTQNIFKSLAVSTAALGLIAGASGFRPAGTSPAAAITAPDSTDPEVISFLVQANQDEIRAARGILTTSKNSEVRAFALKMVDDHGKALTKVTEIGKRLGVEVSDSAPHRPDMSVPSTDSIASHGDSTNAPPAPKPGDSSAMVSPQPHPGSDDSTGVSAGPHGADHAYVDAQVAAHQQVLEKLSATAPKIKDAELRRFVTDVQKTVKNHLAEAKRLEGLLKRTST